MKRVATVRDFMELLDQGEKEKRPNFVRKTRRHSESCIFSADFQYKSPHLNGYRSRSLHSEVDVNREPFNRIEIIVRNDSISSIDIISNSNNEIEDALEPVSDDSSHCDVDSDSRFNGISLLKSPTKAFDGNDKETHEILKLGKAIYGLSMN